MAPRHPFLSDELSMKPPQSSTSAPRSCPRRPRSQYRARSLDLTQDADDPSTTSPSSSSSSSQLRQLETQLIDLKIELATSKTREDYLSLEVHKSHRLSDQVQAENRELRRQLGECLEREARYRRLWKEEQERHLQTRKEGRGERGDEASAARSPSLAESRRRSCETDGAVAGRNGFEEGGGDGDGTNEGHPPSCVKLAYMNRSNAVSCLSLDSTIRSKARVAVKATNVRKNEELEDDLEDDLDDYGVDGDDEKVERRERRQPCGDKQEDDECYYDSNLPSLQLELEVPLTDDDDDYDDNDDYDDDNYNNDKNKNNNTKKKKKRMSHSTSCASGIAFLTGNMTGSTSLLSIREEFSLDSDEPSEGWYEKKENNSDDDDDDDGLFI